MKTTKERIKLKAGQVVHLDSIINIRAFVEPYMRAVRNPAIPETSFDEELSEEFEITQDVTITVTVED